MVRRPRARGGGATRGARQTVGGGWRCRRGGKGGVDGGALAERTAARPEERAPTWPHRPTGRPRHTMSVRPLPATVGHTQGARGSVVAGSLADPALPPPADFRKPHGSGGAGGSTSTEADALRSRPALHQKPPSHTGRPQRDTVGGTRSGGGANATVGGDRR
ncbi:hypothetical protein BU14_0014s0087 [Porphyra umbilicalis]|uniref:Uncharacterized protein n=1 Tax=Porphyra umbilicalis TaxID=2786 RepID=A0A1X6PL26_PORUM|nr:hypothetical protein BU14_0014s0087 [Porphyra umbilicalis]|eukprot:OSX81537.1 hypothetical protein BU14_0014s0087 [Porphyra umbilicalis]